MKNNPSKEKTNRFILMFYMVFVFFLLVSQITIFTVDRNVSVVDDIRSTTFEKEIEILNFSSQIEFVDSQEIKCKYNEVKYTICIEDDAKTIYATKHASYLRNETIKYIVEEKSIKEVSVDDEMASSVIKFIGTLIIELILIAAITFFVYLVIKIKSMPKLGE